jgi:proline iminopeptidase
MFAHVNGTRIYYRIRGKGTPMLTMHGGPGLDHSYFLPWLDPLGEQMAVICYDHRGNGRSERPESLAGVTHDTWIEDAEALRRELGHERIVLFGHSYGGGLALEYALRYGDRLAGLVLCSTAPAFDYLDAVLENAMAKGTREQLAAFETVLSGSMTDDAQWRRLWMTYLPLYFKRFDPAVAAAMDSAMIYSAAAQKHANQHCLPSFNVLGRLHRITTPTLILSGREDWITPPAQAGERIHARIPNSKSVIFEESGHFPFIEETVPCLRAIADWVAQLEKAGKRRYAPGSIRAA